MKLSTKILTGMSVAALSVALAGGVKADAATFTNAKTMTVTAGDLVSYDAVKDSKGSLTWNAKAKWDTYYSTSVDLSNINTAKKDVYVTVKSSSGTNVYKFQKDTLTKYKGAIAAGKLTITENGKDEVKSASTNWANYEYRTEKGTWTGLTAATELSVAPYEQIGVTLYFRHKAAASVTATTVTDITIKDMPSGVTVSTIPADCFSGKEFKVKVPKMANAPAITIDYNTGLIKAKKGAEYRQGASFTDATTGWADSADYTIKSGTAGVFQLRTKATDKKAASKIAAYSWSAVTKPTVTANTAAAASGTIVTSELTYTSPEVEDKAKATFKIKNETTDKTIAIYKLKTDGSADGKAVATLKAGKDVTLKDAKVKDGTELAVMYVGDKKTDKLPSEFSATKFKVIYNVKAATTGN